MKLYYITFRSVTFAQRAEQALAGAGIRCALLRTPKWMEQQGCGYCLRLRAGDIRAALQILKRGQHDMRMVYVQGNDGKLEVWEP